MQNEPGACSGSKTPRVYRPLGLEGLRTDKPVTLSVLKLLKELCHEIQPN